MKKYTCPDCNKKIVVEGCDGIRSYFECPECDTEIDMCSHCGGSPELEESDCCVFCKMD